MAAASLRGLCEEATCSLCLDYFRDPVTVECGHNFCRDCLTRCWENSEGEEVSCPQCRTKILKKLIPARQLANMVEIARKLPFGSAEGNGGICGKHREPLKLFCKKDETPICVVCDRSKDHRDHDVVPLEEAAQDYKKQTKAEMEKMMEKMKEQFRELHSFLNEQEKLLLAELEEVEMEIMRKREEHLARLSEELSSLGGLMRELEEMHQQPPGELLQDVRNLLQSHEKKEPFQKPVAFPPELKWKCWEICDRSAFLAKKMKQFGGKAGCLSKKTHTLKGTRQRNVTLDPKTAHPWLILSEDHKRARNEGRCHEVPDYPERFDLCLCVLGREGFRQGRHYWEVTVESEGSWAVGVAKKSVQRKGHFELSTEKGIWALGKWGGGYRASDLPKKSFIHLSEKLRRIRVSLNYEVGQVAFHDADTGSHLYTFSGASFSGETLLPFFCVTRQASLLV
ncbi:hypothetical protein JRQ81_012310 [Phrynocephalus forsythii]|uniref:Zinc finger protein RFP-like n=1 Tax=Phrynocephalus forsythii TaxID=171643 RepID=A0A9Q0X6I3_9SAUR|nr:hypothetical protein JRQ81_012310 [Phrynocephalus forsythii]